MTAGLPTRLTTLAAIALFLVVSGLPAQNIDERYPLDMNPVDLPGQYESLAEAFSLPVPQLRAPIALLIELETGSVLFARNANRAFPPASLTKIMTVFTALEVWDAMDISMDDSAEFSSAAWAVNAPPQSSLMFLGPRQRASFGDLILGLLVSSGNDAAVAIAETTTGNMDGFVLRMNENARQLGLESSRFVEPSGYSRFNQASAYDLARLTQIYIDRWPWVIERFHMVTEYTYPREENLLPGNDRSMINITQYNRNGLLRSYPGSTGIKTGYIDQSGYNLLASAERDGMHLLAVVMGISASNSMEGSALREADAGALLDFGFVNFSKIEVPLAENSIPVSRGQAAALELPGIQLPMLVASSGGDVQVRSRTPRGVIAPVREGQIVERYRWVQDGVVVGEFSRRAEEAVTPSRGLMFIWDSIRLFFSRLFGGVNPVEGDVSGFQAIESE